MTEEAAVRVAICDDSMGFRALLQSWIRADDRFELAGTAEDGAEAAQMVAVVGPEVLVLDLVLPDVPEPPALVARLRAAHPALRIVLMSSLQTGELERAAEAAVVDAFMHKATTGPALCDLLHRVARSPQAPSAG